MLKSLLKVSISFVFYAFCLATLAGYFGQLHMALELLSHFRLQYCYIALAFSILFVLRKDFTHLTIALCILTLNFAAVYPYYKTDPRISEEPVTVSTQAGLKILQINVQGGLNIQVPRTIKLIEETAPDIVGLSEITPNWRIVLNRQLKGYPYRVVEPRHGGIGFYSKVPLTDFEIKYTGKIKRPRILAHIKRNGYEDTLLVLAHTVIPISYGNMRNIELNAIANDIKEHKGPAIIFGDLNTTSWSYYFQKLLKETKSQDSQVGFGIVPTWSATRRPPLITIDHLLATADFNIMDRKTLKSVGSDHFPVLVKLAYK